VRSLGIEPRELAMSAWSTARTVSIAV